MILIRSYLFDNQKLEFLELSARQQSHGEERDTGKHIYIMCVISTETYLFNTGKFTLSIKMFRLDAHL